MKRFQQGGFSLVQIMIAMGMTGFLVMIITQLNQQGIKTSKTLEAKSDKAQWLMSIFKNKMKTTDACMATLTLNGGDDRVDQVKDIVDLYDFDSNVFFSVGDTLPSRAYQVTRIQLLPFEPNEAVGDDGKPGSQGVCPVEMTFTRVDNNDGSSKITGSAITTETLQFPCVVNRSNEPVLTLTNCSTPQTVNLNSFWALLFPDPGTDDFASWTPTSPQGHVVVGLLSDQAEENDSASLNINIQGQTWTSDASANLNQGVRLPVHNALVWNNDWLFGADDGEIYFGNNQLNTWADVKLMHRRGFAGGGYPVHASTNDLPLHVKGDIIADSYGVSNGTDNYYARAGLMTKDNEVFVNFNRIWRDYSSSSLPDPATGGDLSYNNPHNVEATYNPTGNFWGAFLKFNTIHSRLDLYVSDNQQTVADIEDYHQMTLFADRRYLFTNSVSNGLPSGNESFADGGARYSFNKGVQLFSRGEHNFNMGDNNWVNCFHCMSIGRSNMLDGANYTFALGSGLTTVAVNSIMLGENNSNSAPYTLIGGGGDNSPGVEEDNVAGGDAVFGLAYGKGLELINPYEVAFGEFNYSESSSTDFNRLSVGAGSGPLSKRNMMTMYNSGTIRLSAYKEAYYQVANKPPGDLFLIPPYHETGDMYDADFILGYNIFRRCSAGSCEYHTFGDESTTAYTGVSIGSYNGITLFANNSYSFGNTDRAESSAIVGGMTNDPSMTFSINGITSNYQLEVGGDLIATVINHSSWTSPSDRRLKKEIKDLDQNKIVEKIEKLNPVSFEYLKHKGRKAYGFIAQEVQEIFPSMVKKVKKGWLGINMKSFSALLVTGIQFLAEQVELVEAKLKALSQRLEQQFADLYQLKNQNRELLKLYCEKSSVKKEQLCKK